MNDGLGGGGGIELVAAGDQVFAQIVMVVDFAIEDDPDRTVLVRDRLVAAGDVNDRKAAHSDGGLARDVIAFIIRPAVSDHAAHPRNQVARRVHVRSHIRSNYSSNTTHNRPYISDY